MGNLIVSISLLAIFALAIGKLLHNKKKGSGCTGCSQSAQCGSSTPQKRTTQTGDIQICQVD